MKWAREERKIEEERQNAAKIKCRATKATENGVIKTKEAEQGKENPQQQR